MTTVRNAWRRWILQRQWEHSLSLRIFVPKKCSDSYRTWDRLKNRNYLQLRMLSVPSSLNFQLLGITTCQTMKLLLIWVLKSSRKNIFLRYHSCKSVSAGSLRGKSSWLRSSWIWRNRSISSFLLNSSKKPRGSRTSVMPERLLRGQRWTVRWKKL